MFKPVSLNAVTLVGTSGLVLTAAASRKENEPGPKEEKKNQHEINPLKGKKKGEKKVLSREINAEEEKALIAQSRSSK